MTEFLSVKNKTLDYIPELYSGKQTSATPAKMMHASLLKVPNGILCHQPKTKHAQTKVNQSKKAKKQDNPGVIKLTQLKPCTPSSSVKENSLPLIQESIVKAWANYPYNGVPTNFESATIGQRWRYMIDALDAEGKFLIVITLGLENDGVFAHYVHVLDNIGLISTIMLLLHHQSALTLSRTEHNELQKRLPAQTKWGYFEGGHQAKDVSKQQ